ncbi:MAG: hypothetical protein KDK35_21135 [Leptospiraceae bacterium]|nr:hypothetical protein [Leptospiraceae bacterium]
MSDSIARTLPDLEAALRGSLAASSMSIREVARHTEISKTLLADFPKRRKTSPFESDRPAKSSPEPDLFERILLAESRTKP